MNKRIMLLLHLLKFAVWIEAGKRKTPSTRIIGGHEAIPHSHPYMIVLRYVLPFNSWKYFCGAALLSGKWILTASHCLNSTAARSYVIEAVAGIHNIANITPEAQIKTIDKRIMHPQFNSKNLLNDIAMISTTTPFELNEYIKPAKLPYRHDIKYKSLTLTGWGVSGFIDIPPFLQHVTPNELQELQVNYVQYEVCKEAIGNQTKAPFLNDTHICAGPFDSGACIGDSGGPLVIYQRVKKKLEKHKFDGDDDNKKQKHHKRKKNKKKVPIVVGITSWKLRECKGYTIFARVENYLEFITKCLEH